LYWLIYHIPISSTGVCSASTAGLAVFKRQLEEANISDGQAPEPRNDYTVDLLDVASGALDGQEL
jgi:hypothetical protein